ncbi:hypothetical protein NBRC110019_00510 [Neptunitalea chrysea]|uniref:TonB C-terminal domain-containing protein n=1 Tax=Neptunitalea chrysea TaxID=1647581 RepID=A0A9W6B474_9FLAO|nr:energy transducer TonB [Neptunitalea chrysea]GLB51012.1 hypothetical protein NBRC110019_00510 [Neptunitalea chrysea]
MKNKITKSSSHGNGKEHVPSKYDVNVRRNGALYFQIGLILSLGLVYGMFQISFPKNNDLAHIDLTDPYIINEPIVEEFTIEKEQQKQVKQEKPMEQVEQPNFLDDFDLKDDTDEIDEKAGEVPAVDLSKDALTFVPEVVGKEDKGELKELYDIGVVQQVPTFPGCEGLGSNEEKTACLSEKIRELIAKNFDSQEAVDFGLQGVQKIYVQFNIGKDGYVSDIKTRAPYDFLGDEAERVVKKIPQMEPGKVQGENVVVRYMVPIIFKVQ